ncbi:hypothetical protein PRIPAC_87155 [Pristionchus pacificus]|uniref:Uncharacterized protein n=1 Tax=Pristionchus pacificus TaxID=54126 RepID=A0A2A6B3J2_PRIPA|nr:hypothetical protein PRIPAC_87155 [Pristionchus pacificus]|eukprot:PDM60442.1 hypothetical protein PRIPAC_53420 [Pristionchus pacificus]
MGFQVGIKYSTPASFPQVGIKRAYVPAASSTHLPYKPYPDCLRARVRLTIRGPQWDRLLDVTFPIWSYHHFPQVAIKLDSNLWELLDSKLIPDTRVGLSNIRVAQSKQSAQRK